MDAAPDGPFGFAEEGDVGDPKLDAAEGVLEFAVFTGLRMHLRTCRFRLDATPKRRPQVSQTNAGEEK